MNIAFKTQTFKAVTLIELLVVIAIVSIVTVAVVPSFNLFSSNQIMDQSVDQFVSDLRSVRQKALSGITVNDQLVNWGMQICFDKDGKENPQGYTLGYFDADNYFISQADNLLVSEAVFSQCIGKTTESTETEIINTEINGEVSPEEESKGTESPEAIEPPVLLDNTIQFKRLSGSLPDGVDSSSIEIWSDVEGKIKKKITIYNQGKIVVEEVADVSAKQ